MPGVLLVTVQDLLPAQRLAGAAAFCRDEGLQGRGGSWERGPEGLSAKRGYRRLVAKTTGAHKALPRLPESQKEAE